jgi:hypothetical protein
MRPTVLDEQRGLTEHVMLSWRLNRDHTEHCRNSRRVLSNNRPALVLHNLFASFLRSLGRYAHCCAPNKKARLDWLGLLNFSNADK